MAHDDKLNPAHGTEAARLAKRLRDSGGGHHEVAKHGDGPQRVIHHIHHSGSQHGGGAIRWTRLTHKMGGSDGNAKKLRRRRANLVEGRKACPST